MAVKILRDETRDRDVTRKALAVAKELGLDAMPVDEFDSVTPAEWKALVKLPAMRRFIGTLAEGLVTAMEAEEVALVKYRNMRGARPETMNAIAKDKAVGQIKAEIYGALLRGIAYQAARET